MPIIRAEKTDDALYHFKRMAQKGVAPNQRTYHLIIMSLVREKRATEAETMFIAMRNVHTFFLSTLACWLFLCHKS